MSVGVDFGTMFLVTARKDNDGKINIINERNCFFDVGADFEEMLTKSNFSYIRDNENEEERLFVLGKDALKLSGLYASNKKNGERTSDLRRPMRNMVINSRTDKKAMQMLKYMSQEIVGKPKHEGEVAVISVPADPISSEFNNIFHSNMCQNFIRELGYDVYPINEALAVVYSTNPTTIDEDGEELNMTGISISWGAGGTNCCLAYKGKDTIRFSIPRGGDWLDEEVSKICQMTSSEITIAKEKSSKEGSLNLLSQVYDSDILSGLYIYYKNLVETVIRQFKEEFIKNGTQFPHPIEVIVSGGTSKPEGFEKLVEQVIKEVSWPFEVSCVKRAKNPLSATAVGCLNAAISIEKRNN